jgi:hypothetical protein
MSARHFIPDARGYEYINPPASTKLDSLREIDGRRWRRANSEISFSRDMALYFEDEPQRQMSMKRLSRDEAFLIAVNIAKLPSVQRQILRDIPRPPNTASRDD